MYKDANAEPATNPGRPRHFTERKADDGSLFDSRRQAQAQLAKEGNKKDPASTNLDKGKQDIPWCLLQRNHKSLPL